MIYLMLRSEGSGPSLNSLLNSATRSRPSISHAPFCQWYENSRLWP